VSGPPAEWADDWNSPEDAVYDTPAVSDLTEAEAEALRERFREAQRSGRITVLADDTDERIAKAHAAERERLAKAAGALKFTLYRPGNGPGAGSQALDVVPLTELLALLREQPPATEGTTDAT